jgi:hypothetical protein
MLASLKPTLAAIMYEPADNAMQNDRLNGLETHFAGVRCTVVTSQVTEKNIRRISFVSW